MSTAAAAESFDAKVIGVADGDTVTVLYVQGDSKTPKRVRLSGIDAPEKAQPFGNVARENLARLAFGQVANLDCRTTDRYGRSVCLVRVGGVDVGLRLIELGMAWHFKRYANTQQREEAASYALAETEARAARTGLWRELGTAAEPVAPWSWRKGEGKEENQ
ncbi:MAG: thermonuclease family protein [Casimicrobium sp.]